MHPDDVKRLNAARAFKVKHCLHKAPAEQLLQLRGCLITVTVLKVLR